jgi:hypothetical protein
MEGKNKTGWICCSVDTANSGIKKTRMAVVDDFEKVKEFMKVNIDGIKESVDGYIKDGTLSIDEEITKDDCYYLLLKNNNHSVFECDSIWFWLDSFEFTYNTVFNFNSF